MNHLNSLSQSFSYGSHDISNKPVVLTEAALRSDMLPLRASQMWCFTRIFSLAIGSLVPETDKVWLLYIHLRQILDILFAPSIDLQEVTSVIGTL